MSSEDFWLGVLIIHLVTAIIAGGVGGVIVGIVLLGDQHRQLEDQIDRIFDRAEEASLQKWQR